MRLIILKPEPCEAAEEIRLGQVWNRLASAGLSGETDGSIFADILQIDRAGRLRELLLLPEQLKNSRILIMAAIGDTGINLELMAMLREIRLFPGCMDGSIGAIIVDGAGEQSTKSVGKHAAWIMNMAGCLLIGRPLTEGTGSLMNHQVMAERWQVSRMEAYMRSAVDLLERLLTFRRPISRIAGSSGYGSGHKAAEGCPRILCLHASNKKTSNTLRLWGKVRQHLPEQIAVREIALRNGEIRDCIGCHYDTCMYFSRKSSCYFGGTIVEEVYPALEECDALVLLCPNFNDAVGANLTATINRLTALFRKTPFDRKYLFALIVSGYSGGDIVGRQLIGALNMNKSFILPPYFALMEMANTPCSIEAVPGVNERAAGFAEHIAAFLK